MRRGRAGLLGATSVAATALCGVGASLVAPASAARPPARLLVTATEFRFALSRDAVAAGPVIVQLADRGEDAHDLVLRRLDARGREGGGRLRVGTAEPDATATATVTLRRGRYALFCTLPGHRARGMAARLRVR